MKLPLILATTLSLSMAYVEPGNIVTELPDNPHAFMQLQDCSTCHEIWIDTMLPHEFIIDVTEMCRECHPPEKLGRSHPVGVDPDYSDHEILVPPELPLHDYLVTCGSCHTPHDRWVSENKRYKKQEPFFIVETDRGAHVGDYYKTYYLRMFDVEAGLTLLCQSCHRDY